MFHDVRFSLPRAGVYTTILGSCSRGQKALDRAGSRILIDRLPFESFSGL